MKQAARSIEADQIKEYLNNLPEWDRIDRFPLVVSQLKFKDEKIKSSFEDFFKLWFINMVTTVLGSDFIHNNFVLMLDGAQAIGKSRFIYSLIPKLSKDNKIGFMYTGPFIPKDKDYEELLTNTLIMNIDNFSNYTLNDCFSLGKIASKPTVSIRYPYERTPKEYIKIAALCGSTNDYKYRDKIWSDIKCFEVESVTIDESIDISLLYSQAIAICKKENYLSQNLIED